MRKPQTEEELKRERRKEMVLSPFWQDLAELLAEQEAEVQREWPSAKGEKLYQLQGKMQAIEALRLLPKRLSADDIIKNTRKKED